MIAKVQMPAAVCMYESLIELAVFLRNRIRSLEKILELSRETNRQINKNRFCFTVEDVVLLFSFFVVFLIKEDFFS